jgi:hypothetical protein
MIPTIGIMIAGYAIARLLQVPLEHSSLRAKVPLLVVLSVLGVIVVGFCAVGLMLSDLTSSTTLQQLGR